jgi:hypothetical protein
LKVNPFSRTLVIGIELGNYCVNQRLFSQESEILQKSYLLRRLATAKVEAPVADITDLI